MGAAGWRSMSGDLKAAEQNIPAASRRMAVVDDSERLGSLVLLSAPRQWRRLVDLGEPTDYSAPERLVNRLGLQFLRDSLLRTSSLLRPFFRSSRNGPELSEVTEPGRNDE